MTALRQCTRSSMDDDALTYRYEVKRCEREKAVII